MQFLTDQQQGLIPWHDLNSSVFHCG
jgi:hypothetical protein